MKKTTEFKRVKNFFKNESMALATVCEKENLTIKQLKPAHTETMYVWQLVDEEETSAESKTFTVTKESKSLKEATEAAMEHFQTFQSNLNFNQTETNYVFSRIR